MKKLIKVNWKMLSSFVLVFCLLLIPFNALADPTFVSANDPDLPDKARGVPKGGALRVFDFELDQVGITTLDLQRIEVFAPDAEITIVSGGGSSRGELPGVAYFRGKVADKQGSIVMFAVPKNGRGAIRGLITGKEGAWLFKGKDNMPGIQTRKVDVENELQDKTFECGVDQLSQSATEAFSEFTEAAAAVAAADLPTNVLYTAHMIVDTDYEYFQRFGFIAEDALEYMGDLFAYASSVYEREINTNLLIIGARLFGTNTDPYVENDCGCGTEGALDELQDTWSGVGTSRTLVHLLSGKTSGCGCAYTGDNYVGVLCSQADGYGVSLGIFQGKGGDWFDIDDPVVVWDSMVVPHEIGHNFSSPHTHNYCGVEGIDDPVDNCVVQAAPDEVGDSCLEDPPTLPGPGSLVGGTAGDGNGTLMSYCHFRNGGFGNFSFTFGIYHTDGVAPYRVSNMMRSAAANAGCMPLNYTGSDVRVFKDCKPDEPMLVGETAICTISVQNVGPQMALGVVAVDEYISNGIFNFGAITVTKGTNVFTDMCDTSTNPQDKAGTVTCDLGEIDIGHTAVIEIPVTADTSQNINDRVEVFSDSPDPDMTNNLAEDEVNVVEIADVEVFKDCKPDDPMLAGDTGICTITVKNWGPSIARNVTLDDVHVSNGTFYINSVTPSGNCTKSANPQVNSGEVSCTFTSLDPGDAVEVVVELSTDERQNINDTAIAYTTSYDPDNTNNSAGDGIGVEPVADLALTKTATPDPDVVAGTQLTYNLSVYNDGPSIAENVVIEDVLPAGVVIDSVTSPGNSCNLGVPGDAALPTYCNVGNLNDGGTDSMEIVVTVLPQTLGILGNNAEVSSDLFDPNNADNLATTVTNVVAVADLSVTKTDNPDPVIAGDILTYSMTVQNSGPSTAVDVMLTDALPAGVTYQGYVVSNGSGTCVLADVPPYMLNCDLNDLNPGEFVTVAIKVLVDPSVPDGTTLTNTVTVDSVADDPDLSNNTASSDTTVNTEADLWIDKTGNFPTGNSSGTILYYLTVYNSKGCSEDDPQVCGEGGLSDAQNVVVVDTLPEPRKKVNVEFTSENCSYDATTHRVTCEEPVLHAGDNVTFEIQISIKGSVGEINNVADVTSDTTDPDSGNNHDELLMTVQGGTGDLGGPGGNRGRGGGPKSK